MVLKKILMILISLLLLFSFFFMIIPASLRILFTTPLQGPALFTKAPKFEEKPSLFYESFINSMYLPLLEKEEELLSLYNYAQDKTKSLLILNEIQHNIADLPRSSKYQHESFQPIYDSYEQTKDALLVLITRSEIKENSSPSLFNINELRPYYDGYLKQKETLYQITIKTLTEKKIVFYLEEDGTITVYNP